MNVRVIRNKKQLGELHELLDSARLPLHVAYSSTYPSRNIDVNAYYWGVVLKRISDDTGMNTLELHEYFKTLFNFGYNWRKNEVIIEAGSTAGMDYIDFAEYVEKVRLYAELDLGIIIENQEELML